MLDETLGAMIREGEGQYLEFKESLRLDRDAAHAIVAFANSKGGQLLFGVTDKGQVKGVHRGNGSLEKLANALQGYIYPSLPLQIDPLLLEGGVTLVRIVVPADIPPVIGAYVYSSRPLTFDTSVDASHCQGYRRVGKTSQQVDFMWLRGRQPSDPVVLVDGRGSLPTYDVPGRMNCTAWLADGGPAYDLHISTNPPVSDVNLIAKDFPGSDGSRSNSIVIPVSLTAQSSEFRLVVRYLDDWGCRWESSRLMSVTHPPNGGIVGTAEFSRRIITFPPKRLTKLRSDGRFTKAGTSRGVGI